MHCDPFHCRGSAVQSVAIGEAAPDGHVRLRHIYFIRFEQIPTWMSSTDGQR